MSAYSPPTYWFNGIIFDSSYFSTTTNNSNSVNSSNLIVNGVKLHYLEWRTFTMSVRGNGGLGSLYTITGTTVSSTFCVAGNMLMIKHYYVPPSSGSAIGSGVYGLTVPTNSDAGFNFTVNSIFPETSLTSVYPDGTTFGNGAFIQVGSTTGTITNISYKIISTIPYLFVYFLNGTGGNWQASNFFQYGVTNNYITWSASIPIIIT